MAENGVRRGLVVLALLTAVVAAGAVLAAGGALVQDESDADDTSPENDTMTPENSTVDVDRVNLTVELEPSDDLEEELDYELVVVGNVSPANDAANGTVECANELCVVNGTLAADAEGEDLPRYELRGVVTGASPAENFTAHVNGTLEGDAIEGLGLGAYNASMPNETDGAANGSVVTASAGESGAETSAAAIQTPDGGESSDVSEEASGSGEATEESSGSNEATEEDAASSETTEESSASSEATEEDAASGETTEEDSGTSSAETLQTDGGEPVEQESSGESDDADSSGDGASVTFDGCSTATVEGDAYAYEAGLRYYVDSGIDTSTYDDSEISTPATIDGNDVISDARATDVVIETVLVFDEDFQILTQVENPNYEDCVETIEQQYEESQGNQSGE